MTIFDQDTQVVEKSPGIFTGIVSDSWSVNGNPNGGYLMALMTRAMLNGKVDLRTPIVTANYIARCVPGPAEIRVEEISSSKQFHRFEARLFQEGKEKVRALATLARENNECLLNRYETSPTKLESRDSCVLIPAMPTYTLFSQIDELLDPACAGWMQNRLVERSENKGWIRFKNESQHDIFTLLLIADSLPPPVMATHGIVAWVPTIELSVNIRNLPQSTWLNCCLRTRFITCGLLEADGEIWDEQGNLIAISRQIAQVRKL